MAVEAATGPASALRGADALSAGTARVLRAWLVVVAALVFAMIVVGGATRLTDSGLSITEWQPLLGAIPPLTAGDWQVAFDKYRQIPEYHLVNKGMSLDAFKAIYWWEWGHRFLGRIIGLAMAVPLAVFWLTGRLTRGLKVRLLGILALGGLQGVVGWYMVKSGLVDRVDVSQYRLALHLTIAFVILGALVWTVLDLGEGVRGTGARAASAPEAAGAWGAVGLLLALGLQVVLGAFVAGMKAGLAYNTWPLMDGALVPAGLGVMSPWYLNLFENALTVQFNHRMLAYVLLAGALWHAVWMSAARSARAAGGCTTGWWLLASLVVQAVIGIATLLAQVPLWLGLLHQGGAAVVLAIAVWHTHRTLRGGGLRAATA